MTGNIEKLQKQRKYIGESKPHGDRNRYMSGCRCFKCRLSNSAYEAERKKARTAGEWNGFIDASEVREHLKMLSAKGIGYKTAAAYSGIGKTTVLLIMMGKRQNIRAVNAKKLLAVNETCVTDATVVSAKPTWRRINWLLSEGFTKGALARRLGAKTNNLQIGKTAVTAATAVKVEKLYNRLRAGE